MSENSLEPEELKNWLSGSKSQSEFIIIDVRDDDYGGGHIANSINCPSRDFSAHLSSLYDKYKGRTVVFHCM